MYIYLLAADTHEYPRTELQGHNLSTCDMPHWWFSGKESACPCKRHGFDSWVGKVPWRRNDRPLQYSCLGNPMDVGAWQARVHGIAKESDTT